MWSKKKKKCFNTVCLMEVKAEPLLKQYKLMQNNNYIIWLREQVQVLQWILSYFLDVIFWLDYLR